MRKKRSFSTKLGSQSSVVLYYWVDEKILYADKAETMWVAQKPISRKNQEGISLAGVEGGFSRGKSGMLSALAWPGI
jgi:hypothetical protein